MISEKGLRLIHQPQTMAELEQVLQKGDLYGSLVSFILTCSQEGNTKETINGHRLKLSQFVRYARETFGVTDPRQVTANHIKFFLVHKQQNCSMTTVNNHYRELHRFFAYLKDEGVILETPMLTMRPPKKAQHIIRPFSTDHIRDLLTLCPENKFLGIRNRALILTFMDTGLRLAEMAGIMLEDVNIQTDTIRVMGKGNKERLVPFGKATKTVLLKYCKSRNSPLPNLWLTEEKKALTRRGIEITIIRLGKYAGISGVRCSPHTFRHTRATDLLRDGVEGKYIQTLLGHKDPRMVQRYQATINSQDALNAIRSKGNKRRLI